MPVLTHKEYSTKRVKKITDTLHVAGHRDGGEFTPPPTAPVLPVTFVLQYPEIPKSGEPPSFKTQAVFGKETVGYECVRGLVRTKNETLMKYLTGQGYLLLERKAV